MSIIRPQEHACPDANSASAPLVSIIIPTMNRPEMLVVALESLCRQTFKDFEAVIVNDAGVDPLSAIEPFADRLNIVYVNHEKNKGLAGARNSGLRVARGQYIGYLDDDDFYYEDHLDSLVKTIRQNNVPVVYSDTNIALQRVENGRYVTVSRRVGLSEAFEPAKLLRRNITPVMCVLHERRCIEEVGYFRENLKVLEDWDLWMRMSRFYTFVHLPYATSEYVYRKGAGTLVQQDEALQTTGRYLQTIGRWLDKMPRIEDLRARSANSNLLDQTRDSLCELSIIVHLTGLTPTLEAFFAALAANLPEHAEILLVTDGDADVTRALVPLVDDGMMLIEHPRPIGRTLAHNHAAKLAHGKRLLFLSSQALLTPQAIARMLSVYDEHNGLAIVTARLSAPEAPQRDCCGGQVDGDGGIVIVRDPPADDACKNPEARWARVDCASADCMLVPAAVFTALMGFRHRYAPMFFEDADFCLRMKTEFGLPVLCALDARASIPLLPAELGDVPEARVNSVTFAYDWGAPATLRFPPTRWATPLAAGEATQITCLMPVFNGAKTLREAIDSILMQTLSDFVFLIVDDGSTDETPAILADYARRDTRVRVVTNEKNLGLSASLNRGIALVDTPCIARMDADDIALPTRFALQLKYMRAHPEVAVVGSQIKVLDESGEKVVYKDFRQPIRHEEIARNMAIGAPGVFHPAALLRTAAIESVGGYRAAFDGTEDQDLWLRLLENGEKFANLPEPLLFYRLPEIQKLESHLGPESPGALTWIALLTLACGSQPGDLEFRQGGLIFRALKHVIAAEQADAKLDSLRQILGKKGVQTAVEILRAIPVVAEDPAYEKVMDRLAALLRPIRRKSTVVIDPGDETPRTDSTTPTPELFAVDDGIEVVSFDIFDTLLLRPYMKPIDLFVHLEHIEQARGFASARVGAENAARRKHPEREDITLDDIYEEISRQFRDFKAKELALEARALYANPEMKRFFDLMKAQGRRIVITSDMYLPEDFLAEVLYKNGYDGYEKLYVSSARGKTKYSGNLYREIVADLEVEPGQILHIGDNRRPDYDAALQQGLDARLYTPVMQQYLQNNPRTKQWLVGLNNVHIGESILTAMLAKHYIERKCAPPADDDYWENFGWEVSGPLACVFARFIERQARAKGLDHILFVARDGYILQNTFAQLCPDIESSYVYAPRKAWNRIRKGSPGSEEALNFSRYFASIVDAGQRVGFADTVTINFSGQRMLRQLCGIETHGLYLWVATRNIPFSVDVCFAHQLPEWTLWEFALTSPEFPIETIAADGEPVYMEVDSEHERFRHEASRAVAIGAYRFIREIQERFGNDDLFIDRENFWQYCACFVSHPTEADKRNLCRLYHADDHETAEYLPVFPQYIAPPKNRAAPVEHEGSQTLESCYNAPPSGR